MTVTFVLSDGKEVKVPNSVTSTSIAISSLLDDTGLKNVTIDVPAAYTTVFKYYLGLLNDSRIRINDVDILLLCFNMESFFVDDTFFKYLIFEAYPLWNSFYPHIGELPDERSVYLYAPYEFLPDVYVERFVFFDEWTRINDGKQIFINVGEVYYTKVTYTNRDGETLMVISNDHIINTGDETSLKYGLEEMWYIDVSNQIKRLKSQYRYKVIGKHLSLGEQYDLEDMYGLHEEWYKNGQLESHKYYINGHIYGLSQGWYDNGQIEHQGRYIDSNNNTVSKGWYKNGKLRYQKVMLREGKLFLEEQWYESGQLASRVITTYEEFSLQCVVENWYENGKPLSRYKTVSDRLDGLEESWYENGQMDTQSNHVYGSLNGIQRHWSEDGQLLYERLYEMNKLVSELPLLE